MAGHWNNEYYDNLEFFYWEPQHLGRMKNPESDIQSVEDAVKHLRHMEVCLNHQMNLFFQLAPKSYQVRLFETCFGGRFDDDWTLVGREFEELWSVQALTQPDLFFAGRTSNVCIELKLSAKLSLEQVLKYVYLNMLEQQHSGTSKQYFLLFMGRGGFENQWTEKFADIGSMRSELSTVRLSESPKGWASRFEGLDDQIFEAAEDTSMYFMNYEAFAASLVDFRDGIDSSSPYAETMTKLFDGMLAELRERGLATLA
jgi:hypothetical protein|tara:strand:+ start:180 stop:950 length:771 start_codon:yes stop_codon:yes gene_type:complete